MDTAYRREIAKRVFAYELSKTTHSITEGEGKAPKYVLLPTGERCNRVFMVGVLLDKEEVSPDTNFWRLRISDPTGVISAFVGRFQTSAMEAIIGIEPPEVISIVAKVNLFEGETRKMLSLRPESIAVVDIKTRDYFVLDTAKRTLERIKKMLEEEDEDCRLAKEIYGMNVREYIDVVKKAVISIKEEAEAYREIDEAEKDADKDREEDREEVRDEMKEPEEDEFEIDEGMDEDYDYFEFDEEEFDLSDILDEEE
ncbi:Uncharacterized protein conserved in archaea [Archaeoglobus sulfaticallidus PM70-1]|uniref:Uncharacterized protein conserved in archaea n=1 Tax=Archaeoglobus sulfaticallidus PM70-1 TaxID=387631 RepID=N0BKG9_9EURY|nr:hypothetical protein [Archaeoglobus sulfaticallidus]AGK60991.1 Uncharacterized protein conserved in archaea [Archaeoglobus sulfaticallidus PM70-1]